VLSSLISAMKPSQASSVSSVLPYDAVDALGQGRAGGTHKRSHGQSNSQSDPRDERVLSSTLFTIIETGVTIGTETKIEMANHAVDCGQRVYSTRNGIPNVRRPFIILLPRILPPATFLV